MVASVMSVYLRACTANSCWCSPDACMTVDDHIVLGSHTELLTPLVAKMVEEPFKLLIMDSITANLRVDFSGRGELAERCTPADAVDLTQQLRVARRLCMDDRQELMITFAGSRSLGSS
jgi:hypothetical protein